MDSLSCFVLDVPDELLALAHGVASATPLLTPYEVRHPLHPEGGLDVLAMEVLLADAFSTPLARVIPRREQSSTGAWRPEFEAADRLWLRAPSGSILVETFTGSVVSATADLGVPVLLADDSLAALPSLSIPFTSITSFSAGEVTPDSLRTYDALGKLRAELALDGSWGDLVRQSAHLALVSSFAEKVIPLFSLTASATDAQFAHLSGDVATSVVARALDASL